MEGGYKLNSINVETRVEAGKIGNYRLGDFVPCRATIQIKRIGRADDLNVEDLQTCLRKLAQQGGHGYFFFSYASSAREAFEQECHDYHAYAELENERHPARPSGTDWLCPSCNYFGARAWWRHLVAM